MHRDNLINKIKDKYKDNYPSNNHKWAIIINKVICYHKISNGLS